MGWFSSASGVVRDILGHEKRKPGNDNIASGLLIVRRGFSPAYYFFCDVFAKEHGLRVVPDRRANERRHWQRDTPEDKRRNQDRRNTRWPKEDFVVVRDPKPTPRLDN